MSLLRTVQTLLIFVLPACLSMMALSTKHTEDDQEWLRYWVVIALFSLLEIPLDQLEFVPGYNIAKLLFILWCLAPGPLSGTEVIYGQVIPFN